MTELSSLRVLDESSLSNIIDDFPDARAVVNGRRKVSMRSIAGKSKDETTTIPEYFNSRATVEYLGMQETVSNEIFQCWVNHQQDPSCEYYGRPIVDTIIGHVEALREQHNAYGDSKTDDVWRQALEGLGCDKELADAILDPDYTSLRYMNSAAGWLIETIRERWSFLEGVNDRVKNLGGNPRESQGAGSQV